MRGRDLWYDDDDRLLMALREALRAAEEVPPEFVDAGRAAYAWHNIDAELAALTYDSAAEGLIGAGSTRAESASLRALTYATHHITIELEVTADAIFGQLLPPQTGSISAHVAAGHVTDASADEMGFFAIRPMPKGAFRLRCRTTSGADVLTGWITP
jgi:hypothetical protein